MIISEYQEKAMRTVNSKIPLEQLNEGGENKNGYPYIRTETYQKIKNTFKEKDIDIFSGKCLVGTHYKSKDGYNLISYKEKLFREHQVIAYFIFGDRMVGKQINHLNLIRDDNRPQNLELCSASENIKHSFSQGLRKSNRGKYSKLNETDVVNIRKLKKDGETLTQIAKKYGVAFQTISKICNYERWAHVPDDLNLADLDFNKYQELAKRTIDPNSSDFDEVCNYSLGLVCEAGEVSDIVKKQLFHGHEVESCKILEELGDTLWYMANLATKYGLSLRDIASHNVTKLQSRYPTGFSVEDSIKRVDTK